MSKASAFLLVALACGACASVPEELPAASPEHPLIACIANSPFPAMQRDTRRGGDRPLPEIVRVIGYTTDEDGRRLKVLRAGEYDVTKWQPWPREKIQTRGCGPEADAFREIASRSPETKREERP